MPPRELLRAGREEVSGYGGTFLPGTVSRIARTATGFDALLDHGTRLHARRLLVATGLVDALPDVPGLRDRFGRDVLHCPYCHGYEVRNSKVGVLGGLLELVPPGAAGAPVGQRRRVLRQRHQPHR
jgi:thioredoxin reductase